MALGRQEGRSSRAESTVAACVAPKKKKKSHFWSRRRVPSIPWLCRIEGPWVARDPRESEGWACLTRAATLQSLLRVSPPGALPQPRGFGAEDMVRPGTRRSLIPDPSAPDPHSHLLLPEAAGPSGQASARCGPHGAPASHGEPALRLTQPECGRDARRPAGCQAPGQGPGRRDEWPVGGPASVTLIFGCVLNPPLPASLPLLPG